MKRLKAMMFLGLLLGSVGCVSLGSKANEVTIYPIDQTDIIALEQGDTLVAPKRGFFVSDFYVKEVMAARVR